VITPGLGGLLDGADEEARRRLQEDAQLRALDIVDYAQSRFYIEETAAPIVLLPHQQAVLRYPFRRLREGDPRIARFPSLATRLGHFPFTTVVESTVKKGGKTTMAAVVARFFLDTQTRFGEIYCCGNDFDQARERAFKIVNISLRLTPGCKQRGSDWIIPGQYTIQKMRVDNLQTGSHIVPISVDSRGEAGGNPDLTLWTELWGFDNEEARRFWAEMTPPPTKIDSLRLIDTYAGFDGESDLLKDLFDLARAGVQLTAGELAEATDTPLDAFEETGGDPAALVPVWVNEKASLFTYWDEGEIARRMPWQRGPIAEAYYKEKAFELPPAQFSRLHLNQWTGGESEFVPIELWDSCQEDLPLFTPDTPESAVLAVDAAVTGDCFGIVAITRHPTRHDDVAIRRVRKWDPKESGGLVNYAEPERFLRALCKGACAAGHPPMEVLAGQHLYSAQQKAECEACRNGPYTPPYRIVQIAYDPFQLESMMQGLRRDHIAWCEPFSQMADRLKSDRLLYDLIMNHRIAHDGDPAMREHIMNAKAKHQKDQDSTMRLVKKSANRKIDLAVCASMGAFRVLYLLL
jgi:Phage Terminase